MTTSWQRLSIRPNDVAGTSQMKHPTMSKLNTVSFIESFAPSMHYNLPRCRDSLEGLLIEKANAMSWLCSSAEADLETLLETFY